MTEAEINALLEYDRQHVWHPYSSMNNPPSMIPVVSARGVRLTLADGRELIDGMASWWSAIHGYNHPILNTAMHRQVETMSHVMFGGITHPSAINLCKLLVNMTPQPLQKVFLSDSGSVAVEVAIKMALQYWNAKGNTQKTRLLSFSNGYHGDTFGAMAVTDPVNGMHHLFASVLPQHVFAESPSVGFDEEIEEKHFADLINKLELHHEELAAVIIEPIVQGAGGMKFYSPLYLKRLRTLCDQYQVLLILDEIATGFGRTGKLFGCEHAGISPDIMCVGKAITGGYMSLAATLCTEDVAQTICQGEAGVFMHGPTFMANPLACSVASASIRLLLSQPWQKLVKQIELGLQKGLAPAAELDHVADVRVLGAIGVIELKEAVDMGVDQARFVEKGVWVRPFGKLIYVMPPYIMKPQELETLTHAMVEVIKDIGAAKNHE
jgi:adenosylmethionine-8-amino-7-oxononanoate aminotransferase